MIQIGIIVFAVLLSMLRLGVPHIEGYESHIDAWFKKQGVLATFSRVSLSVERLAPKVLISGLSINDRDGHELLTLNSATFEINVWQSLLTQNVIIDQADLFLSKAVFDTKYLNQTSTDVDMPLLSPQLIQSLLAFKRFTLKIDQLDIVNQSQRYALYDSDFSLTGDGDIRHLTISSALLQQQEGQLKGQLSIDFSQFMERSQVSGNGFVALNITSLSAANLPGGLEAKGQVFIKNWVKFDAADWSIKSHLKAHNASIVIEKVKHNLELDSLLELQVENGLASASLNNKILSLNKLDWKDLRLMGQADISDKVNYPSSWFIENISVARAQKTLQLFPKLTSINSALVELKPKGKLNSLLLQIPNVNQLGQSRMRLRAKDIQWNTFKGIPSVNKISLDVVASQQKLNALVRSSDLKIHLADHYTEIFMLDRLTASINGQVSDEGWLIDVPDINVHSNAASIKGRLSLNIQNDASPHMFLRLHANNASMPIVTPFLPQLLMDKDVLNWVKHSVKKAQLKTADVLYFGRLENDVNFDVKNNGIFETALKLENVNLLYDPEWPSLQSQQIDVTFKNYQLIARSQLATAQGLKATRLKFSIANLNIPKADLSLEVNGPLEKQWAFLKNSPIKSEIPYFSNIEQIKGYAKTRLMASFPLANDTDVGVKFNVQIATHKAGFDLDKFGVSVSDLNGMLHVTQDKIAMKAATAKWFKQPVDVEISNAQGATVIKMKGDDIDVASLLNILPSKATQHISGKSTWKVQASFNHSDDNDNPSVRIEAHSGLNGTAIHLPPPFSLSTKETRHLKLNVDVYPSDNVTVHLSLDNAFDARMLFEKNKKQVYDLSGGNIEFGGVLATTSIAPGLHLSGKIDALNVDKWAAYFSTDDIENFESSTQLYLAFIDNIDLTINQLHLRNIVANQVKLTMSKGEKGLKGILQSSVANGRIFIPVQQAKNVPIEIDFDNVDITLEEGLRNNAKVKYKTDDIPNLVFNSKQFSVNGKHFTNAQLEIESNVENQFMLKKLSIQHKDIKLSATGQWLFNETLNEHESSLKINIQGKKFGQTISELGIGDSIEDGEINFNGNLTWPDAFWSLDFSNAKGGAKLNLSDGYLLDIEPGEGRFVGLLSLSALPRRLTLDFSDFFKKGLEFDQIKGDFSIHDGSMWTTNLKMSGSVSDVNIVGRTGLKEKDYDQVITIIPQVRDALPVLGSLVAGSSVGWAMLLFQRLFKDPIDDSVSIKYKVTGHWDAPKIDLIEKPVFENTDEPDF